MRKTLLSILDNQRYMICGHVRKFVTLSIIFWTNLFIRFDSELYKQMLGVPMGTNCAPFVADLFLFSYKRDFKLSLSYNSQADVIVAFNYTSRYVDDLLNTDNPYFEKKRGKSGLQLSKVFYCNAKTSFFCCVQPFDIASPF